MKRAFKILTGSVLIATSGLVFAQDKKEGSEQVLYESAYCAQVKEILGSQKTNSSYKKEQLEVIRAQLTAPCDAHRNAPLGAGGSDSSAINSLKVVMQMEPQSAGQLAQVYDHLYRLVVEGTSLSDSKTDYVLYKGILRNLKTKSVQVMMQDFAHVKKTQILINSLKTSSQWAPQQKIDDEFRRTFSKVNALFKQHIVDMYPAIAIDNERLEYALESQEQLEQVRAAHSKLIPAIFEVQGAKNSFYKAQLSRSECSFMQAFYPGQSVLRDLEVKCDGVLASAGQMSYEDKIRKLAKALPGE